MHSQTDTNLPEEYDEAIKLGVLMKLETLTVGYEHYKAELTVKYWWTGTVLRGFTEQYRVTSNGNTNGNIVFGVHEVNGQGWQEEISTRAIQDGEWHQIIRGAAIDCPTKKGRLYFKYIFDRSGTYDPAVDTNLYVNA